MRPNLKTWVWPIPGEAGGGRGGGAVTKRKVLAWRGHICNRISGVTRCRSRRKKRSTSRYLGSFSLEPCLTAFILKWVRTSREWQPTVRKYLAFGTEREFVSRPRSSLTKPGIKYLDWIALGGRRTPSWPIFAIKAELRVHLMRTRHVQEVALPETRKQSFPRETSLDFFLLLLKFHLDLVSRQSYKKVQTPAGRRFLYWTHVNLESQK